MPIYECEIQNISKTWKINVQIKREILIAFLIDNLELCFLAHSIENIVGLRCPLMPERKHGLLHYVNVLWCPLMGGDMKGLLCFLIWQKLNKFFPTLNQISQCFYSKSLPFLKLPNRYMSALSIHIFRSVPLYRL